MQIRYKKLHQARAFFVMMKYFFLAQTRNPATFAFGFLFPVVFISIFGLIGNSPQVLTIGLPASSDLSNPIIKTVEQQKYVQTQVAPQSQLEQSMKQGKLSGIISVNQSSQNPPKYTVNVTTSAGNPQAAAGLISLMNGIVDQTNLHAAGVTNPPIVIKQQQLAGQEQRYIDFALPGQIGFA